MQTIVLTRGFVNLVDDIDYDYLMETSWRAKKCNNAFYAAGKVYDEIYEGRDVYMHRVIAARAGMDMSHLIDHINLNTMDNRRCNLRPATYLESAYHRRGSSDKTNGLPKGIVRVGNRYRARISSMHIGYFATVLEALVAYSVEAKRLHGEFAYVDDYRDWYERNRERFDG